MIPMEPESESASYFRDRPIPAHWRPMLTVNIATGEILLDRLAEVMGEAFGSYSRGSVYGEGRKHAGI
jgi:hypothetical protein